MISVRAVLWPMTELSDCVEFSIWESFSCVVSPFSSLALIASARAESSAYFSTILA